MKIKYLAEKHLDAKHIKASRLHGELPKIAMQDIDIKLPELSVLVKELDLLKRLSYHAFNHLAEAKKQAEANPDDLQLKFKAKTLLRNNAQSNSLKDLYLNQAIKDGLAVVDGVYQKNNRKYAVVRIEDQVHVCTVAALRLSYLPVSCEEPEQYAPDLLEQVNTEFSDTYTFGYAIGFVRKQYNRLSSLHQHLNKRIAQHNRIYPQILRKIASGEITVIQDQEDVEAPASAQVQLAATS